MHTLKSLALQYGRNEITLDKVKEILPTLDFPVHYSDVDGGYFEGNEDNTVIAVESLVGDGLTLDQFREFSSIL